MDFSKLSKEDLDDFINRDYSQFGITPKIFGFFLSPLEKAEALFNRLKKDPNVIFPIPVVDLYLATHYSGSRDQTYTKKDILNLSPELIQEFAQVLGFDPNLFQLEENRQRILRMLDYMGLIIYEDQILFQYDVLQRICSKLSIHDLNNFRIAHRLSNLECPFKINDPDKQIKMINYINDQSVKYVPKIVESGSIKLFLNGIHRNELELVKFLLDIGLNPNVNDENKEYFGLIVSAGENNVEMTRLLIENRADPGLGNREGVTPLHVASRTCNTDVFNLLLEYRTDPYALTEGGLTTLMLASEEGCVEIVNILINLGINLDTQEEQGYTALMWTAENGQKEIAKILVDAKADVNLSSNNLTSALHIASSFHEEDIIKLLIGAKAEINFQDINGDTALIRTINPREDILWLIKEPREYNIAKLLLENGANPDIQDNGGETALMISINLGMTNVVELLLEKGANPNIQNNQGETAWDLAREWDQLRELGLRYGLKSMTPILEKYGTE